MNRWSKMFSLSIFEAWTKKYSKVSYQLVTQAKLDKFGRRIVNLIVFDLFTISIFYAHYEVVNILT